MGVETIMGLMGAMSGGLGAISVAQDNAANDNSTQQYLDNIINKMQGTLGNALNNAMTNSQGFTNQAVNQQNTSLNNATNALNTGLSSSTQALISYLNNANTAANTNTQQGFNTSQALQSPYALMGYNAADLYSDSLGLSRPAQGSAAFVNNLNNSAQLTTPVSNLTSTAQNLAKVLGKNNFNAYGPLQDASTYYPTAPTAPTVQRPADISQDQERQLAQNNIFATKGSVPGGAVGLGRAGGYNLFFSPTGGGGAMGIGGGSGKGLSEAYNNALNNGSVLSAAQQYLQNQGPYASQMQAYNAAQQNYQNQMNQYNSTVSGINSAYAPYQQAYGALQTQLNSLNPQQLQTALAYNSGLFNNVQNPSFTTNPSAPQATPTSLGTYNPAPVNPSNTNLTIRG